jgi:exodeoxyribonuclease V alpha subunit
MFVQNILNEKEIHNKIEFDNKTIKMYDKVMHLQNRNMKTIDYSKFVQLNENDILDNYTIERKVMNGQVGIVLRVTSDVRNKLYVYYPLDDYVAIYTLSDVIKFKIIDLGYVMTVHKSQGSQYSRLLMPMVSRFSIMLNTQLLYTAVTRAKDMLTIIGEKRAFEEASTNISKNRRITLLNNYMENN